MLSDIIGGLAQLKGNILFTAAASAALAAGCAVQVRLAGLGPAVFRSAGIMASVKKGKAAALSLIIIRLLFYLSIMIYSANAEMIHIYCGAVIFVALHLLLGDMGILLYDIPCSAVIYGGLYVRGPLNLYQSGSAAAMRLALAAFITVFALCEAIICIGCIAKQASGKTYKTRPAITRLRAALLLAGALTAALPFYFVARVDTVTVRGDVYQYTQEGKTVFTGKNKIIKSGNGCVLVNNKLRHILADSPLYSAGENRIMVPRSVSIIRPELSLINRVGAMSALWEKDGKYFADTGGGSVRVSDFFLFDGRDTYMFFEDFTVGWEDQTVELAPFSYITVKYGQSVGFYDRASDGYSSVKTGICSVTVKMSCGATVNLSKDILYRENGQEQILFLQPDLLEDLAQ